MTKNDNTNNLSGAAALDALSPDERAQYELAISSSEEARSEATELQDTAVLLGLSVEPVEPSAGLRERLLAQVAQTPQLGAVEPEPRVDATPAERRAAARWSRPILALTSAAAAVALIVGGIAVATGSLDFEPTQAEQMAAISEAADMQQVQTVLPGGEKVTLRWSPTLASSAVIVDGMDPAPADKVYQLWYMGEEGARPAGILEVTADQESWHVLDGQMAAGDTVGVTLEPEGGSEQPTGDPIMVIEP